MSSSQGSGFPPAMVVGGDGLSQDQPDSYARVCSKSRVLTIGADFQ
jgi:hypothetical protein